MCHLPCILLSQYQGRWFTGGICIRHGTHVGSGLCRHMHKIDIRSHHQRNRLENKRMETNELRLYSPLLSCILVYGYTWLTGLGGCAPMEIEQILIMAILGLFLSMITAIGEEIGWRGFLLTELRATLSYKKINFAIGIIWYLYHMPLIIFPTIIMEINSLPLFAFL